MTRPSPAAVLFAAVCLSGTATAALLAVLEARSVDPVRARIVTSTRTVLTTVVTSNVRNSTDVQRCVSFRVIARDRAGHDLATSGRADLVVPAHASLRVVSTLTLTPRAYAEQLDQLHPVPRTCRAERR